MTVRVQEDATPAGPERTEAETPSAAPAEPQGTPAATPQEGPAERPEGLPEGFASVEELAQAYASLKEGDNKTAPAEQTPEALDNQLQSSGLDFNTFVDSYQANGGKLSEADYAALSKVGFGQEEVDAVIAGMEALQQRELETVYEAVGGREEFTKVASWARTNLSPDEIAAYNAAIDDDSLPTDTVKLIVAGVRSRFEAANGSEPSLIGGSPAAAGMSAFESEYQVTEAMRDPRYRSDPAYRKQIEARIAVSPVFGR